LGDVKTNWEMDRKMTMDKKNDVLKGCIREQSFLQLPLEEMWKTEENLILWALEVPLGELDKDLSFTTPTTIFAYPQLRK
jgi:hypothetical protein